MKKSLLFCYNDLRFPIDKIKLLKELYPAATTYEDKKQSGTITKNQERNSDCDS